MIGTIQRAMALFAVALSVFAFVFVASCGDDDDDDDADDNSDDDADDVTWVALTGGTFLMGCKDEDQWCEIGDGEFPQHEVTIGPFELMATEVTQELYAEITGLEPSYFEDCPQCPVENVTWDDAVAFCEQLGGRLPTEAEWEFAAWGGVDTLYYCGNDEQCVDDIAWHSQNSYGKTHPIRQKTPNDYGLYDMLGNVFEWVEDWFDAEYYANSPAENPTGPASGETKVIRGGSWLFHYQGPLRASCREANDPDTPRSNVGFRCAR